MYNEWGRQPGVIDKVGLGIQILPELQVAHSSSSMKSTSSGLISNIEPRITLSFFIEFH